MTFIVGRADWQLKILNWTKEGPPKPLLLLLHHIRLLRIPDCADCDLLTSSLTNSF